MARTQILVLRWGGQNRDFNFWCCFAGERNPEINFHLWGMLGRSIIIMEKMGRAVILL